MVTLPPVEIIHTSPWYGKERVSPALIIKPVEEVTVLSDPMYMGFVESIFRIIHPLESGNEVGMDKTFVADVVTVACPAVKL
jgi:hypothetical protein